MSSSNCEHPKDFSECTKKNVYDRDLKEIKKEIERINKKNDELSKRTHDVEMSIVKIETGLKHTLENKHAEALSTAEAIDTKFKWVSVIVGGIASFSIIIQLISIMLESLK